MAAPSASAQMVFISICRAIWWTLSTSCLSPLPATILSSSRESQAVPSRQGVHHVDCLVQIDNRARAGHGLFGLQGVEVGSPIGLGGGHDRARGPARDD